MPAAETTPTPDRHEHAGGGQYLSTACLDGVHPECRRSCKWCPALCACPTCEHTGPVKWVMVQYPDGAWWASMAHDPDQSWRLGYIPAEDMPGFVESLRAMRWLSPHVEVEPRPYGREAKMPGGGGVLN